MAADLGTGGAQREHRPLPSVDVALLPHERRAARLRIVAVACIVVLGIATAAAAAFWNRPSTSVDSEAVAARAVDPPGEQASARGARAPSAAESAASVAGQATEPQAADPSLDDDARPGVERHPFGEARGFRDALQRAGLDATEAAEVVTAMDGLLDFRRCRPEHELVFERDGAQQLVAFEYHSSVTEVYRADRGPGGTLRGRRLEIPIDTTRVAKGSYISGSLGGALESVGLGRSLAGVFVQVFEGRARFARDTREGDYFRLIVDEEYVDDHFLGYGTVHALQYQGQRTGKLEAFWYELSPKDKGDFYDPDGRAMHGGWLRTPLRYDHISSPFDRRRRHPILKRIVPHHGIDYAAPSGTTVWAAADGVVTFAGRRGANGNLVSLRHANGYQTHYAHLSRIRSNIKRGVRVEQRQAIGSVGTTGRSTGPHLHFALKRHGRFIDPAKKLNGPGELMPRRALPAYKRTVARLRRELEAIEPTQAPVEQSEPAAPRVSEIFHEQGVF